MPSEDQYVAAARDAATHWGLDVVSVALLNHSENVVFDVELGSGEHVVLRLHRPGYNTAHELRSEVAWVEALAADGLPVPRPLAGTNGEYYVEVPVGDETRQAGLIEWVDGAAISGLFEEIDQGVVLGHYERIGGLAATIRSHNQAWEPPSNFVRRRWDAEGLMGEDPLWGRFWLVELLSDEQRDIFARARRELYAELSSLSIGPDRFGRIHADLHLGNLMANDDHVTVIDFDDAGYGWFAYELAVALDPVSDEPWFDGGTRCVGSGLSLSPSAWRRRGRPHRYLPGRPLPDDRRLARRPPGATGLRVLRECRERGRGRRQGLPAGLTDQRSSAGSPLRANQSPSRVTRTSS